jgi:ribosomal protein L11 methyltransferase
MKKSWGELRVEVHPFFAEAVANFLIELGSPGVIQEEIRKPPKRERIIAYFSNDRSLKKKKEKIQVYLRSLCQPPRHFFTVHLRIIQQEDWAETWKVNFKTTHVTPSLVVKPPWEEHPPKKGEIVIEVDPGMAFGTGSHPSTRMCLQALEEAIPSFRHHPSLLDVGTGSGILAIAAQKMGAKRILAVDTDPTAIACAEKNTLANGIHSAIDFRPGSLKGIRRIFDIVVANLLPQELLSLASSLPKRVSSRGILIVSGLLRSQKKEIHKALASHGLNVQGLKESKGWVCLVFARAVCRQEKN